MKDPITVQKVEDTLLKTINKFSENGNLKSIQLLLLPTLKYSALKHRQRIKDINLTEIL